MGLLQQEAELQEVVQLVGYDALPEKEKNVLDIARILREDFLQQSAFDEIDQYCSIRKQYGMLKCIVELGRAQSIALDNGISMSQLQNMSVRQKISRMKEVKENEFPAYFEETLNMIHDQSKKILEVE